MCWKKIDLGNPWRDGEAEQLPAKKGELVQIKTSRKGGPVGLGLKVIRRERLGTIKTGIVKRNQNNNSSFPGRGPLLGVGKVRTVRDGDLSKTFNRKVKVVRYLPGG